MKIVTRDIHQREIVVTMDAETVSTVINRAAAEAAGIDLVGLGISRVTLEAGVNPDTGEDGASARVVFTLPVDLCE